MTQPADIQQAITALQRLSREPEASPEQRLGFAATAERVRNSMADGDSFGATRDLLFARPLLRRVTQ